MAQPYFVGDARRLDVQRPRLQQLESGLVACPLDFHRDAHDVLDLPQQSTQLGGLRRVQARLG